MQISEKYGLVYVITKLGLLFVYDLQTATAVYRNRISPDPIFLTAAAPSNGGFYAINRYLTNRHSALHLASISDHDVGMAWCMQSTGCVRFDTGCPCPACFWPGTSASCKRKGISVFPS